MRCVGTLDDVMSLSVEAGRGNVIMEADNYRSQMTDVKQR
jgi:hypothetical protein